MEMINRWRREMMTGTIGVWGSAGAMVYADLPEGPSLVSLLAAVAVTPGYLTSTARPARKARGPSPVAGIPVC